MYVTTYNNTYHIQLRMVSKSRGALQEVIRADLRWVHTMRSNLSCSNHCQSRSYCQQLIYSNVDNFQYACLIGFFLSVQVAADQPSCKHSAELILFCATYYAVYIHSILIVLLCPCIICVSLNRQKVVNLLLPAKFWYEILSRRICNRRWQHTGTAGFL